uniref:UDP-glycosyltransferases domain-containing protein n=1 Tax=Arundo donax TaxID=35708 RepID=A0A0A9GAT4_ARUDO
MAARMQEARGILVNSFESLEPRAARALRDGLCVPGRRTPPAYFVGPLVSAGGDKEHACLRWLDAQPDRSVVFLCFGSMGTLPKHQLEEIAIGLESSGQRFLWVVRSPPGAGDDLDALLPAGFQERTKGRGLAVGGWAPQAAVLLHRAAGAFVTHCWWNSTLEGVAAGLPLLCWPLYAEQRLNKVWVVEEMELGVEIGWGGPAPPATAR